MAELACEGDGCDVDNGFDAYLGSHGADRDLLLEAEGVHGCPSAELGGARLECLGHLHSSGDVTHHIVMNYILEDTSSTMCVLNSAMRFFAYLHRPGSLLRHKSRSHTYIDQSNVVELQKDYFQIKLVANA